MQVCVLTTVVDCISCDHLKSFPINALALRTIIPLTGLSTRQPIFMDNRSIFVRQTESRLYFSSRLKLLSYGQHYIAYCKPQYCGNQLLL